MMAEQKTPENIKVQSRTEAESAPPSEPTPKGEKRPLAKQQLVEIQYQTCPFPSSFLSGTSL